MAIKKRLKLEKDNKLLRHLLYDLATRAERVSSKYGVDDDGNPSDWSEWSDLRVAIQQAMTKGRI